MAWISVDQKLIGGKLRSLYKAIGCSQNEAIGILISLWLWGIDNADMEGLIVSADRGDIKGVFQSGLSDGIDSNRVVDSLIETGWIDEENGRLYLHDWEDWRSYYNRYMKEKKGNSERQARYKERQRAKNSENNVQSNVTDNATEQEEKPEASPPKGTQEAKYGKEFETFWSVYPKKADKGQAYKKYKARIKDGFSPEELLQAAGAYGKQCERQHTDQQYIKHAKTFLGDSLPFTDYLPRKQEQPAQAGNLGTGENPFRRNGG